MTTGGLAMDSMVDTELWVSDEQWDAQMRAAYPWWARPFLIRELPGWMLRATDAIPLPAQRFPNATLPHVFVLWLRQRWWSLVGRLEGLGPPCPHCEGCTRWTCQAGYANFEHSCSCADYGGDG